MTAAISPARFAAGMPRGLEREAAGLTVAEFNEKYCPTIGFVQLSDWISAPDPRPGLREYSGTLRVGARTHHFHSSAAGPIAALTGAMYDAGFPIEVLEFHQRTWAGEVATFVRCEHNGRRHWAAAVAPDGAMSSLTAMVAAAAALARA